jgi:hypothetical protein
MDYLEVIGPETHSIISIQDGGIYSEGKAPELLERLEYETLTRKITMIYPSPTTPQFIYINIE